MMDGSMGARRQGIIFASTELTLPSLPSIATLSSLSRSSSKERSILDKPAKIPTEVLIALDNAQLDVNDDGVVSWRPNSISHPRQWHLWRKVFDSSIVCFLEFFMTLVSNCGSSIAIVAGPDLNLSSQMATFSFVTIYLLGQALGGLVFPPVSEAFGGRTIYVVSTFGFAIFSLLIAALPILPVVLVGRFVTGLLSAMPAVVACGTLENVWDERARIWVIHFWISGAVLGLSLGPPVATYVSTSSSGWTWIFNISAIVTGMAACLCFGLRESRPSQVLRSHVLHISSQTGFRGLSLDVQDTLPSLPDFVAKSLALPLRMFFTEPINALASVMAATVYGIVYMFAEALPIVYLEGFNFSTRECSLVFLAISVGIIFTFLPRIYDVRMGNLRHRQGTVLEPEDKLFGFYVAAPVLAAGLWWFAVTVPPLANSLSPWPSIASLILVGFSVVEFDNVLCGYLCDTYASFASSATAPMSFLRATMSGVFPLFGRQMFRSLGANVSLYILACIATLYCTVAVFFGKYGKAIREQSPFAEKTRLGFQNNSQPSIEKC